MPLSAVPPFPPPATALPNLFRSPVSSRELIVVGVAADGAVVSVKATQTLVLRQTADYRITVPAPAKDVVAGPGSESKPGLRRGAILWQGFAAGHRVLSAEAILEPRAAVRALPLRISISRDAVRLENATATSTSTFTAVGDSVQMAKLLDALRADPQGRTIGQSTYVKVTGRTEAIRLRISAPLRVTGRVGGTSIALMLGGGRPAMRTVRFQGRPSVHLTVEPVPRASVLRPPRGRTWVEALRLGTVPAGRALFRRVVEASLTLARVRQYDAVLANPDPLGPIGARYVYRTVAAPVPVPPPSPDSEGLAAWAVALIVAGSVAAAGGLAVFWAHS